MTDFPSFFIYNFFLSFFLKIMLLYMRREEFFRWGVVARVQLVRMDVKYLQQYGWRDAEYVE